MPLIKSNNMPAYDRLLQEGQPVLDHNRASSQDIRELHIGVLNMMQDAALEATERQFLRLIGNSSQIVQIKVHFFTLSSLKRNEEAKKHIEEYYTNFEKIKASGLDALIITGANITEKDITKEPFWPQLTEVLDWASVNVSSVLCACLASHAAMTHFYDIHRTHLENKLWGLFPHLKTDRTHPLMSWVNTAFNVPHSRHNTITKQDFLKAGCHILVESKDAGIHIATSPDKFRFIFVQGHLEYDTHSVLKEYKREVMNFANSVNSKYPPFPENYLGLQCQEILNEYKEKLEQAIQSGDILPEFPEEIVEKRLFNTWRDSAKSIMNNWIGFVYKTTHYDLSRQYMDGIDPDNPLGIA